jgi:hypothetical protein
MNQKTIENTPETGKIIRNGRLGREKSSRAEAQEIRKHKFAENL